jgi:hypothetical protein
MIGTRLAHYEIVTHLGSGGMGGVGSRRNAERIWRVIFELQDPVFEDAPTWPHRAQNGKGKTTAKNV